MCSLGKHWFLQGGLTLIACVHCALQTHTVSCKQFSNMRAVCKCFFFFFSLAFFLKTTSEGELRGRGDERSKETEGERQKVVFLWVKNKNKARQSSTRKNYQPPIKRNDKHWRTFALRSLKVFLFFSFLKRPDPRPRLLITHRLSAHTNSDNTSCYT